MTPVDPLDVSPFRFLLTKAQELTKNLFRPLLGVIFGLGLGVLSTWFSGENPWAVFMVLVQGAFGSAYSTGMTLFYATPLILTGLAVALPFHGGLFNVGAEGQLVMGATALALLGVFCPDLPRGVALPLGVLVAFGAGAFWGFIPGWLKAKRGSHEVITTIMLNFVAAGLASWVVLYVIKSTDSQNPESALVGPGFQLGVSEAFDGAPITGAMPMALLFALLCWILLRFTVRGFQIRAVGKSPEVAETSGISSKSAQILVMTLAGGLAGLVGVVEVMGHSSRFKLGFSPDYGFIGIPVALLARSHPLGLVLSAVLFGALHKGASELDLETTYVTRDLSLVIQALVILAVSAEGSLSLWRRPKKTPGDKANGDKTQKGAKDHG